jgi:hypothetical protein
MASVGGIPFENSNGSVTSITAFLAKFSSPVIMIALGVSSHRVAITTISSNAAASAKFPAVSFLPCFAASDSTFSQLLEPILTVCPVAISCH